ncbi:cell division protein [Pseudoxanthomonas broegbernensis]|uniref:Cell division protein n=1 Tax=Pseudoxanthomonas broegbernensis TaxID=83619 RepID=A0A7V8K8C1_9GAMM|nr:AAA family ATPase [Pseudoxanthomonas broegbernensis]KAF1687556.1 cell division protein [Pseudoxanthomonas broegbernensis]MBB6064567.1 AAA+ superfamily predicted ATPase [Pseudoxanthomonas broegbernensis]
MKNPALHLVTPVDLPRGIHAVHALPDAELSALWDSIIVEPQLKDRLLSQAILNYTLRPNISRNDVPLHGVILLVGLPGTGKTSLARGLASKLAAVLKSPGQGFRLVEVDPHALTSSAMGKTQRAVSELFSQTIAEHAANGPTVVLLDEVETLAADRAKLSLEANPVDIHRATDAVLVQLDALAASHPNLLFIATSNFPQAIDDAFTSRCDLVVDVPLPGPDAVAKILGSCLDAIAQKFPMVSKLTRADGLAKVARAAVGLDGRAIRKLVVSAMAMRKETALDPNQLSLPDLQAAVAQAQASRRPDKERP